MMAHGSGQSSETERLQKGLDICLYRAKPEAKGSQNAPLQSQIYRYTDIQSLTLSRVHSSGQQK